jgi:hypothetical protein
MEKFKKITDITLLQGLKSSLLGFWPERKNNNFPAPLPVSIERKNFKAIKKFPYVVSLKSDGTRCLLMAYNKLFYLVDRAFDFYETKQNFLNNIYGNYNDATGMILDGELMKTKDSQSLCYYAHDCICMFSTDITKEYFPDRYDAIITALSLWSKEGSDFEICAKKFYMFKDVTASLINNSDHEIDGLIFTPVRKEIGTGTQYTLFKWKDNHTFDFMISEENNEYILSVIFKQSLFKYASVKKRNQKFNALLKERCANYKNGDIIEFSYNSSDNSFEPLFIRKDKTHPNNKTTADKTRFNISENITLDEIIQLLKENENEIFEEDSMTDFIEFDEFTDDLLN